MFGDISGDGKTGTIDVISFGRQLAGFAGYENRANVANADFDGDLQITALDMINLVRYLAKWNGYESLKP